MRFHPCHQCLPQSMSRLYNNEIMCIEGDHIYLILSTVVEVNMKRPTYTVSESVGSFQWCFTLHTRYCPVAVNLSFYDVYTPGSAGRMPLKCTPQWQII